MRFYWHHILTEHRVSLYLSLLVAHPVSQCNTSRPQNLSPSLLLLCSYTSSLLSPVTPAPTTWMLHMLWKGMTYSQRGTPTKMLMRICTDWFVYRLMQNCYGQGRTEALHYGDGWLCKGQQNLRHYTSISVFSIYSNLYYILSLIHRQRINHIFIKYFQMYYLNLSQKFSLSWDSHLIGSF